MIDRNSYQKKKSAKNNIGFYIALAICIVTIAAAAWTTYGSVVDYNTQPTAEENSKAESDVKVNNDVSGQKYESSEEKTSEVSVIQESFQKDVNSGVSEVQTVDNYDENVETVENVNTEISAEPVQQTVSENSSSRPVENGKIIKEFSPDNPIKSKTTSDWRTHKGIDISASSGTPVHSITGGTVKSVYKDAMLGNVVCIEHTGGYTAYYCGLTETTVARAGNAVSEGDTIGYVGIVPSEVLDESHLHIEVKKENQYINPSSLF